MADGKIITPRNNKSAAAALCALLTAVLLFSFFPRTAAALTPTYDPSASYKESVYYNNLCAVSLTGDRRTDIVAVAQSQVGYHEGANESALSGSGSSSGNCTEYGYAFGQTKDAWCAMFVWWCANQAGIPESIVARTEWARVQTFGCPYLPYAQSAPQMGDIAFIDTNGDGEENHVGLIAAVDDRHVTVIEGNCSDMVQTIRYRRGDGTGYGSSTILYVGAPEYDTAGSDYRTVTYARILSDNTKAYKSSSTVSKVMATVNSGDERLLLRARDLLGQQWHQVEFGLNAYWIKAENCALFTATESGGTTAPTTASTTTHTTTSAATEAAPAHNTAPSAAPTTTTTASTLHTVAQGDTAVTEYGGTSPDAALPAEENTTEDMPANTSSSDEAAQSHTTDASGIAYPDLYTERVGEDYMRTVAFALVGISGAVLLGVIIAILRRNRTVR
ncbi:MAG: CHAP domain-containing protein [Ruminococcaceae bacterium]|nr:CHAP domain-containing protein [Oscillospiraceae bacterium]